MLLTPRPYQVESITSVYEGWKDPEVKHQLLSMATGCGKCLGKGTPVLMFDGSIRPVEEIRAGDLLMGPDSTSRTVASTCQGTEMLYRVVPTKGDPYVVNESHILSLKMTTGRKAVTLGDRRVFPGETINVSVQEWMASTPTFKHCAKGWRAAVDFELTPLQPDMPPYMLGLWLGDGTATTFAISKPDEEVRLAVASFAESSGHQVVTSISMFGGCPTHRIVSPAGALRGRGHHPNVPLNALRALGVLSNKHIPHAYKTASRQDRLEVLAGILDADGCYNSGGYDYITIDERLAEDVAFVARSLGFAAYPGPCLKGCQNGHVGLYHRMSITGDLSILPVRIPRRKAAARQQKKRVLVTGITVQPIGEGEYYGFEIGDDGLFMLGDFTVTHNTIVFSLLAQNTVECGGRALILAHTDELIGQALDKFTRTTGLAAGKEKAASYASPLDRVVVGSVQTMQGDSRLSSWKPNHFQLVVVDEAHRSLALGYQKILNHFSKGGAQIVGVTATVDRGDQRTLGEFYHRIAFDYNLRRAVLDGWLVRPIVKTMPVTIDLTGVTSQQTADGSDLNRDQVSDRLKPFIDQIAQAIGAEIGNEKVLVFMPSVETAQIMSDALNRAGVSSLWVCGDKKLCPDRIERIARHQRGDVQALCNMAVLTEGYDDDSIKNIVCLRATKIRSLYCQIVGRGTRPLKELVPLLNAAPNVAVRRELIAKSAKPHVKILDFLWLYERHNLCGPADLLTKDERLKKLMGGADGDLMEVEAKAERDLLDQLEKEVRKNARKKSTTVDPLALATDLGDVELATYEPETAHDALPPTDPQKSILSQNGIKLEAVKSRGQASLLIDRILARHNKGLCTVRQVNFFKKLGRDATGWRKEYASEEQRLQIAKWNARREEAKLARQEQEEEVLEIAQQCDLDLEATMESLHRQQSLLATATGVLDPNAEIEDFSEIFGGGIA